MTIRSVGLVRSDPAIIAMTGFQYKQLTPFLNLVTIVERKETRLHYWIF